MGDADGELNTSPGKAIGNGAGEANAAPLWSSGWFFFAFAITFLGKF